MVNAVTDKYEKTLFAYWILNNENIRIRGTGTFIHRGDGGQAPVPVQRQGDRSVSRGGVRGTCKAA